LNDVSKR